MKRNGKRDILIEFTARYLSADEADAIRQAVAAMKPKLHLVMANWRWLEVRGLAGTKAPKLIETLKGKGLRFNINGP